MNDDDVSVPFWVLISIVTMMLLGMGGCYTMTNEVVKIQKSGIELGYAEYNKITGDWQWVTNR